MSAVAFCNTLPPATPHTTHKDAGLGPWSFFLPLAMRVCACVQVGGRERLSAVCARARACTRAYVSVEVSEWGGVEVCTDDV